MSKLEVDAIEPQSGTTLTIGASGDTINLAAGATAGFGKILNVIQATTSTQVAVTGNTFTDTTLTASITPISTSNKILVLVNQSFLLQDSSGGSAGADIRLMRDSTVIVGNQQRYQIYIQSTGSSNEAQYNRYTMNILDEPSTTSSIVYKTQCVAYTGADYIATSPSSFGATIILMEVSG
jgi:hypothetical protein